MWIATMDTEHFAFIAKGTSEKKAREAMARAFARHCREYTRPGDRPFSHEYWGGEEPDADKLNDVYGMRLHNLSKAEAFRDGEAI